ncbi:hypothetical protein EXD82_05090 [Peptacetobacter hominis]|uniref:ATP-grasp domain-containing protein n=1 Tax=Peptacetobacter hominis TaxID=2743610 RepID=A0A544QVR3_9FIRM|nr:hypothetical protein [Peptacetobacter hominis]TQQ84780.1 hypothetical protein EXD82_05090 [Peptacetobacter hominis]
MKKILYMTDLYYNANGRKYYEEDLYITGILRRYFDIAICNPRDSHSFENDVDLIVFRNTGGVKGFKEAYEKFVERVHKNKLNTFNEFVGKGDMKGKQYLIDLTEYNYPVIPTIDSKNDLNKLLEADIYVIKPIDGADSIGLEFITKEELLNRDIKDKETLIQPMIDFEYEVSFYFINNKFEYAMYAPDKEKRWKLEMYNASDKDLEFAMKFIEWNDIKNGIQRIDACRTKSGELLLVELEDLNPYLSILEVDENTREKFITDFIDALKRMCGDK